MAVLVLIHLAKLKEYVDEFGVEKCIKDYQSERQKYYEDYQHLQFG